MATLRLEGVKELNDKLVRTQTKMRTLSVPFKKILPTVWGSVGKNFSVGGRPRKWDAPKKRTGKPLRKNGHLKASVIGKAGASIVRETHSDKLHTLEIGTAIKYANVHQFGFSGTVSVRAHARKGTKGVKAHSRKMNIPQREFLLLQEEDKTEIMQTLSQYLKPE